MLKKFRCCYKKSNGDTGTFGTGFTILMDEPIGFSKLNPFLRTQIGRYLLGKSSLKALSSNIWSRLY